MGPPSLKSFEVASISLSIIILSKDRLRFTIAFSGFEEKLTAEIPHQQTQKIMDLDSHM